MGLSEYMQGLKRRSKSDPIPGTGKLSDKPCPLCSKPMFLKYKCCGQPYDMLVCNPCNYKEVIP